MDIGMMSIVNSNTKVKAAASLAVTKMAMDNSKQNAENMNDMLKSADPSLGNKLDARA